MTAFFAFLLAVLLLVQSHGTAGYDRLRGKCSVLVQTWAEQAIYEVSELSEDHRTRLKELLYFLHVPRTGGRTYHQCLLRHLYPKSQHCDRSYDKLRFNSSNHCRLLVNHDDYSIITKLPAQSTSVVTNLRHPVDRIFSAYEFSVEVASRFLASKVRVKAPKERASRIRGNSTIRGPSTLSIWPWSLLVPWMRDDLFARENRRRLGDAEVLPIGFSNYDASSYVMPLREFIRQPMVIDILHNGATFQVAGLTNNSYIKEAGEIRNCVVEYPDLGLHILDVAKRRMNKMIFVGLTERQRDSAKLFAHVIGGQILPLGVPGMPGNFTLSRDVFASKNSSPTESRISDPSPVSQVPDPASELPLAEENLTVYGLIEKYENCVGQLRGNQVQRRINSLKYSLPVNFSVEARNEVPEEVLDEIIQMNALDLELYAYARQTFQSEASVHEHLINDKWDAKNQIIAEGFQGRNGSRITMHVSIICMTGGVMMMVFVHGSRILKLRKWRNPWAVHEKW